MELNSLKLSHVHMRDACPKCKADTVTDCGTEWYTKPTEMSVGFFCPACDEYWTKKVRVEIKLHFLESKRGINVQEVE